MNEPDNDHGWSVASVSHGLPVNFPAHVGTNWLATDVRVREWHFKGSEVVGHVCGGEQDNDNSKNGAKTIVWISSDTYNRDYNSYFIYLYL